MRGRGRRGEEKKERKTKEGKQEKAMLDERKGEKESEEVGKKEDVGKGGTEGDREREI